MLLLLGICSAATLAVLPFDNHTGDKAHDSLGFGVADMLVTDLGQLESLDLVERSRLRDVLAEMALSRSDYIDPSSAAKAGKGVGAEWMLVGSISALDPNLRLDARLVDVESGKVLHSVSAEGKRDAFFDVEKDLAFLVTEKLGIAVSAREAGKVGRVATESYDAFRAWSEGLDALDRGAVEDARREFEAALGHDSGFGAANAALGGLKESIDASDAVRASLMDASEAELEAKLEAYRDGKLDDTELAAALEALSIKTANLPPSRQRTVCKSVLELDLPETLTIYQAPHARSANDWAMGCYVVAANNLKDRAELLAWGKQYVERYPTGTWYTTVRFHLDRLVGIIEKEESARKNGVPDASLERRTIEMLDDRCTDEPDYRRIGAQCREWLARLREKQLFTENALFQMRLRAERCADVELLTEIRKESARIEIPLTKLTALDRSLETRQKYRAEASKRSESTERALADGRNVGASAIDPWVRVCDFEGAARELEKLQSSMDAREVRRAEWTIAKSTVDLERMRALGEAARSQERPFRSVGDIERDLDDARKKRLKVDQARARLLEQHASDLDNAGLQRQSAETLEALYTEFPDYYYRRPENILGRLGFAWYQTFEVDAPAKARHYYELLIERFPDSNEADNARQKIGTLPK